MSMNRIIEDSSHYEIWKNTGKSRVVLKRLDRRGDLRDEMIGPEKSFHMTPAERRLNQELASSEKYDPFSNGQFVPVQLIETAEDVEAIKANPNLIGDAEIATLLDGKKTNWRAFDARLEDITNPAVLQRMLQVAEGSETITARSLQAIEKRLAVLSPAEYTEIKPAGEVGPRVGNAGV